MNTISKKMNKINNELDNLDFYLNSPEISDEIMEIKRRMENIRRMAASSFRKVQKKEEVKVRIYRESFVIFD